MSRVKLISLVILSAFLWSCQTRFPIERVRKGVAKVDALIIVHPTYSFDQEGQARDAINFIAKEFLRQGKLVYTLVESPEDLNSKNYQDYFPLINETKIVFSKNGENDINLIGTRFAVMGGYLKACLRSALIFLSKNYLSKNGRNMTFFLPLPAIYGKGLKINVRDWKEFNLHHWLPKDTSLKIIHHGKTLFQLKDKQKHSIILHFRGPNESPFQEDKSHL